MAIERDEQWWLDKAAAEEGLTIGATSPETSKPADTYRGFALFHDTPPIPIRAYDWSAAPVKWDLGDPVLHAATREAVIAEVDRWWSEEAEDYPGIVERAARAACRICDEVGGSLVACAVCGRFKAPRGRSVATEAANGYCGGASDCPGYQQEPAPGHLWPGERYGDSLGHMDWHEQVTAAESGEEG